MAATRGRKLAQRLAQLAHTDASCDDAGALLHEALTSGDARSVAVAARLVAAHARAEHEDALVAAYWALSDARARSRAEPGEQDGAEPGAINSSANRSGAASGYSRRTMPAT